MADLPELPPAERRRVDLLWKKAIKELGFTGQHYYWPTVDEKRREVARMLSSHSQPQQPDSLDWPHWHHTVEQAKDSAEVMELVGVEETTKLARRLFDALAEAHMHFCLGSGKTSEDFDELLIPMREPVIAKLRALWEDRSSWFDDNWFSSACRTYVEQTLDQRDDYWSSEALDAETARLRSQPPATPAPAPASPETSRRPTFGTPLERWSNLELIVVDDHTIRVELDGMIKEVDYAEMGFADPRGSQPGSRGGRSGDRGPTKAWWSLLAFANYDGALSTERAGRGDAESRSKALGFTRRRVCEIRDRLKHYFQLDDDPIPQDSEGYRTAFKISRAAD